MNIKINTPLHKVDRSYILSLVNHTIWWCMDNLGTNNRRRNKLDIKVGDFNPRIYGCFDDKKNIIEVYYMNHKNVGQLIQTIIHEYTHHLQPCRTHYNKLLKKYSYMNHPFEKEAFLNEQMYYNVCWSEIKKDI